MAALHSLTNFSNSQLGPKVSVMVRSPVNWSSVRTWGRRSKMSPVRSMVSIRSLISGEASHDGRISFKSFSIREMSAFRVNMMLPWE